MKRLAGPVSKKNEMRQFAYKNEAIFDLRPIRRKKSMLKSGIPYMIPRRKKRFIGHRPFKESSCTQLGIYSKRLFYILQFV